MAYLHERRAALGAATCRVGVAKGKAADRFRRSIRFKALLDGSGEREMSTTMAFVRFLSSLTRDKSVGKFVVPIVPDEARTFGMEGMFRQLGIYSSVGQLYKPSIPIR